MLVAVVWQFALVAVVLAACVALFVLGFLNPQRSQRQQFAVDRTLAKGQEAGSRRPGLRGRLVEKPFANFRRAANKSAAAGRSSRWKLRQK